MFLKGSISQKVLWTALLLAGSSLLLACGQRGIEVSQLSSHYDLCVEGDCTWDLVQGKAVSSTAVVTGSQVLKSWQSCLGVQVSSGVRNTFNTNARNVFPLEGEPQGATGPVVLQAMTLAGEVCSALVNQERNLEAGERRIFNSVNLDSNSNPFTREVIQDVVTRVSRSCYGRQPAAEDFTEAHRAMVDLAAVTGSGGSNTRRLALMLCTGLMASTSGLTF